MGEMGYEAHGIADEFPRMSEPEFRDLVADIATNGQRESIWLYEGKILDGRHRYLACVEAGVEPRMAEYVGEDPVGFAWSLNGLRRHLSPSQRALMASDLANMRVGRGNSATWRVSGLKANGDGDLSLISQEEAAAKFGVGVRSVQRAGEVRRKAVKDVIEAVKQGGITLKVASEIASKPKTKQVEALADAKAQHGNRGLVEESVVCRGCEGLRVERDSLAARLSAVGAELSALRASLPKSERVTSDALPKKAVESLPREFRPYSKAHQTRAKGGKA